MTPLTLQFTVPDFSGLEASEVVFGGLLACVVAAILGRRRRYPAAIAVLVVLLVFVVALIGAGVHPLLAIVAIAAAGAVAGGLGCRLNES